MYPLEKYLILEVPDREYLKQIYGLVHHKKSLECCGKELPSFSSIRLNHADFFKYLIYEDSPVIDL